MKILHTADWHIGQLFYDYDRAFEHQQFLTWLVEIIAQEAVDVLLISGDVFDLSNPSASSIKLFYGFLNNASKKNPNLQIIVTAGNHDSAYRLETPKPLLESSKIHIVGFVERSANAEFAYSKLIIPITDLEGNLKAACLAIPFLRLGDYPSVENSANPYASGVEALYKETYNKAVLAYPNCKVFLALGHLHAVGAEITDMDKSERPILGGIECISADAFPSALQYVALGHIHKAQKIGGREHIRYSGSPIPLSFSELNYRHQVVTFEIIEDSVTNINKIEIPIITPLLRVPLTNKSISDVLTELATLPNGSEINSPYLEVKVLSDGPEPNLRNLIDNVLQGKNVRLVKIDNRYRSIEVGGQEGTVAQDKLSELKPIDVFTRTYMAKYNSEMPEILLQLFNEISNQVSTEEA